MAFPFYKQYDSMDCGPTCLRMIAKHYKKRVSIQALRDKAQIGKDGVNLLGISDAAESIGFRTQALRLNLKIIKEVKLPAILHWDQKHFVVLYKINKGQYYIADPAREHIRYDQNEFKAHWVSNKTRGEEEGVILLVEPSPNFFEDFDSEDSRHELSFSNILEYIYPYKKLFFQLFLGLCIGTILQLILPFLTQSVVDIGIGTSNLHFVYIILLAQLSLLAGRMIVDFLRSWVLFHISARINVSILSDFLIKLTKLPISFFDSKRIGDILQRMSDHQRIESFLTGSSLNILFSLINLVIFSIVLILFSLPIFLVAIIGNVLYSLWVLSFFRKRKELDYKRFNISSKKQSVTIQLVQGMQEVKLHGCEKPMRWKWEQLQAKLFKLNIKGLFLSQRQATGAFFLNEGKNILITFLSVKAVIDGDMTLGTMLAVQNLVGQINSPMSQMLSFLESWQAAKISMERLNEIHKIEDEEPAHRHYEYRLPSSYVKQLVGGHGLADHLNVSEDLSYQRDNENELIPPRIDKEALQQRAFPFETRGIVFDNVSFTYVGAGNEPVLKNINLVIPYGRTTAIVGTSGSGKTTLLKLLLKFYEPQKGEIRLGETSLSNISHKYWRSHCGVVMQESFVFADTIAQNIAVGVEKIDMDLLHHAARMANIDGFVRSLPLGFNSKIGQEGIGISTGQKQRILIARAIYRSPDFIFFDEATNSLDANNERSILGNLESFFKGRTVVVVAHRLSTVKNADQIVLINNGEIKENGTHQELINLKGEYFSLIKNQLELGSN